MADLPTTPIEQLPGLGQKSAVFLNSVGIDSIETLRDLGPVFVYATAKRKNPGVTLNLLWAMAAGLQNRNWKSLTDEEKEDLKQELEELQA